MTPEDPRAELERLRKLKRLRELETKAALTGPKMPIGEAARIAGRQGRTLSLADEAAGIRGMAGIPQWAYTAYQAVNPMARYADIGLGLAGLAGEAMNAMPESYTQARDVARGELSQARTDRPVTSFLAEMGEGAVYPAGTLRMGAPILGQSLKMAGIGGLYGGATGYAGAEGDTEQRLGSAALYGGLGAGIGAITPGGVAAALPVFRAGKTAVAKAVDAIVNLFGGTGTASEQAAREVAEAAVRRSMERSNMTPERIAEAVERYRDKPAVLAEVIGQDALNALTSLTRRPGVTPQLAQDIISERFGAFPERAGADVRGAADVPEAFIEGDLSAELAARRAAAGPEYQQLYAETPITQTMQPAQQGPVTSERLRNLMETPFISSKLRAAQNNAITRAVAEGRSPDSVTTLEILDSVKRIIDDEIGKAVKNKAAEEINFLTTTRDALVGELDRITEGRYAAVREIGGEAPRLQAAQQLGNKWRTMKLPEFMRAVQETNPQDMPALQAAVMGSLENSLRRGELNPRVFRTQDIQGKIRAVFGPEAGDELIRRMVAEAELRETGARFAPRVNSVTGTVLESAPSEMLDDGIRFATALARGDRIGIINQAISFMRRRGYTQRQIDEMGRLLLSDPQEGLRRLGVRLPTAPNTGGAASIAAPNAFTGGGPEGPTGGSGPAGPQGPSGGPATPVGGMSAMPEANPFASAPATPQATENAFTSPYFGRQSMRSAVERGPSERVLAMQADWAPVSEGMSQASVSAGQAAELAQQATTIRSGPERQAAAERAAQAMQAVRAQIADIQAQRAGMATPEDQRLQDLIDLLEPTNDPVLLQSQATMVQQNLARINQAIGLAEVPRPMPPQPSAARRLGFQPTVRDESAVAGPRPVAGRYAGAGDDTTPQGFAGISPNAFVEPGIGSVGGSVAGQQYDITDDGVIDERDIQAGAMMGMAGIPLAARMMRGSGAMRGMGYTKNESESIISAAKKAFDKLEFGGSRQGLVTEESLLENANIPVQDDFIDVNLKITPDLAAKIKELGKTGLTAAELQRVAPDVYDEAFYGARFSKTQQGGLTQNDVEILFNDFDLDNVLSDPDYEAYGMAIVTPNVTNRFAAQGREQIQTVQDALEHKNHHVRAAAFRKMIENRGLKFEKAGAEGVNSEYIYISPADEASDIAPIKVRFSDHARQSRLHENADYNFYDGSHSAEDIMQAVNEIEALLSGSGMRGMGYTGETPPVVQQAKQTGYEGADTGESAEWLSALRKGLKMDTASRMARAKEMGFDTDTVLYHGTGSDIEAFRVSADGTRGQGVYLTPKADVAEGYASVKENASVMPLYVRGKIYPDESSDVMSEAEYAAIFNAADKTSRNKLKKAFGGKSGFPKTYRKVFANLADGQQEQNALLEKAGYAGRSGRSRVTGDDEVMIFNPANIRSVNAAFDPEKSSSPDLLAGLPFAVGGAGLGMSAMQSEERPNAFVQ